MPARSRVRPQESRRRPAVADRMASRGALRPREGREHVGEVQRARMLAAAAQVLAEHGYEGLSVSRVTHGARVSRRTFYDLFEDREDCFRAVFEDALARVSACVLDAYGCAQGGWRVRVRAGLAALLAFLDSEPALASVLVVAGLRGGSRVLARRAEALAAVGREVQAQGALARRGRGALSPLAGEGVVGGVFAVLHTRLSARPPGTVSELLNPLVAMVVLPFLGAGVAQRELEVAPGVKSLGPPRGGEGLGVARRSPAAARDPLAELPMRLTYRTLCVLEAIARQPGASNRVVGERAEIYDQGQISKLLARLARLGLIVNSGVGQARGEPNAWSLTTLGERVTRQLSLGTQPREDGGA